MKEKLSTTASVIIIFLAGVLFGGSLLYNHLRLNALEQRQVLFEKSVENFAGQVNEEFKKLHNPKEESK